MENNESLIEIENSRLRTENNLLTACIASNDNLLKKTLITLKEITSELENSPSKLIGEAQLTRTHELENRARLLFNKASELQAISTHLLNHLKIVMCLLVESKWDTMALITQQLINTYERKITEKIPRNSEDVCNEQWNDKNKESGQVDDFY